MKSSFEFYLHAILMTDNYKNLITKSNRDALYMNISLALEKHECKLIEIGGTENHIHFIFKMNDSISIDQLIKLVKLTSQLEMQLDENPHFFWHEGYYTYSIGRIDIEAETLKIKRQKVYHHRVTLDEELLHLRKHLQLDAMNTLTDLNENCFN